MVGKGPKWQPSLALSTLLLLRITQFSPNGGETKISKLEAAKVSIKSNGGG